MSPLHVEAPLRVLLLCSQSDEEVPLLKDDSTYVISTRYYSATIPIWRDNVPTSSHELEAWKEDWSKEQAIEVIEAIGAYIVCVAQPRSRDELSNTRSILRGIHETIEKQLETSYNAPDPLFIALLLRSRTVPTLDIGDEEWDDLCCEEGRWEFINAKDAEIGHGASPMTNELGEKIGIARLKEALEANDWQSAAHSAAGVLELDGADSEGETDAEDFGDLETAQDSDALRRSLLQHGVTGEEEDTGRPGDEDVRALESMMLKMQAVREAGTEMPEAERKKLAMKTVNEVMKTL